MLVCEDLKEQEWRIFGSDNFNQVFWALGLLPQDNVKKFLSLHNRDYLNHLHLQIMLHTNIKI